jgi:hypothetical protein
MKTTTRLAAFGVAGLLIAGLTSAVLMTSASAGARYNGSPVGTLSLTPASGTNLSAINYSSSGPCPSGDSFYTLLFGAGMPDAGEIVTSKTSAGFSTTAPVNSAFQKTPRYYADKNGAALSGTYDVVLRCTSGLSNNSLGDFRSFVTFSSATAYTTSTTPPSGGGALTLSTSTPLIQPNQTARLHATGSPNTTFELMCYSRPNSTYTSARKVATTTGSVDFTLLPGTNTRCLVRYLDSTATQSPSVLINVATTLSLSAVKNSGVRSYTFQGRNLPRVAGQLITLYRISNGTEIRSANLKTDATGIYKVVRTFTGTGTFSFIVRTSQTLNNAAGKSNVYRITIR